MPKSFASSLLLRRYAPRRAAGVCGLIALASLTLLATGCGGSSKAYDPAEVQAAFATAGISLPPSDEYEQVLARRISRVGLQRPTTDEEAQPLTTLLEGVRDAVFIPALNRPAPKLTVLRGPFMTVYIYPRTPDADGRANEYSDRLEAAQILGDRTGFGYFRKGNVVVRYTVFDPNGRVPGRYGRWDSTRTLELRTKRQVTAALARLD